MAKNQICRHCHHAAYAHINGECVAHDAAGTCGCIRFEAFERKPRQRMWVVSVAFFEKNRWMPDVELRVHASTAGGASQKAVREAKRQRTSKRRILQTRIVVVPLART